MVRDLQAGTNADAPRAAHWMLVQGDADDVVDPQTVLSWVHGLDNPPKTEIVEGAGHFFHGRLTNLRKLVVNFLASPVTASDAEVR